MRITGPGVIGEPLDPDQARRVLRRAVELGVELIDTAHAYGPEVSERLIGETLAPYPEGLVIATKSGLQRSESGAWPPDGRPETIRSECERSLALLRVERIDLLQLHRPDPQVPIEESLGAMVELRAEGKIDLIGVSNVSVSQLARARAVTEDRLGAEPLQRRRPGLRGRARGLRARREIAFLPWFPLGAGSLTKAADLEQVAAANGATARKSRSRGSSSARPRCCRSRAPRRSPTSRRTWPPPDSASARTSLPGSQAPAPDRRAPSARVPSPNARVRHADPSGTPSASEIRSGHAENREVDRDDAPVFFLTPSTLASATRVIRSSDPISLWSNGTYHHPTLRGSGGRARAGGAPPRRLEGCDRP